MLKQLRYFVPFTRSRAAKRRGAYESPRGDSKSAKLQNELAQICNRMVNISLTKRNKTLGHLCGFFKLRSRRTTSNNPRWNPHRSRFRRNVSYDKRHGANFGAACDTNVSKRLRIRPKLDVISNFRRSSSGYSGTNSNPLTKGAIASNHRVGMNEHITKMIYTQSRSYFCIQRNADSSNSLNDAEHSPIDSELDVSNYSRMAIGYSASKPIDVDGPDRLFPEERSSRITREISFKINVDAHSQINTSVDLISHAKWWKIG